MKPYIKYFLLLMFVIMSIFLGSYCDRIPRTELSESELIGDWLSSNLKGSQRIVLKKDGIAELYDVFSIECGTYDKIQVNNNTFNWHLSKIDRRQLIDISSNKKNICLSFELVRDNAIYLKPEYSFVFPENKVPIYKKMNLQTNSNVVDFPN